MAFLALLQACSWAALYTTWLLIKLTPKGVVLFYCCRPVVLQAGESDLSTVGQLMRFVFLSNFTGHPAISLPAGHNSQGSVYVFSLQSIRFWQLVQTCASSQMLQMLLLPY